MVFAWFPLDAVARGAQLTVVIGGVTVRIQAPEAYAAVDVDGLILSVAIDASNSATITRSANTVAGHVRADLSMGDNDFHCYIPAESAAASGGGLNQSQVDARIADWAETSNTDAIPASKLSNAPQTTFTRYANEAALPAIVPAGTVAWVPES